MKIKIVQCSNENYWYKDLIGESFPLVDLEKREIRASATSANTCYVAIHNNKEHVVIVDDCEVTHEV